MQHHPCQRFGNIALHCIEKLVNSLERTKYSKFGKYSEADADSVLHRIE